MIIIIKILLHVLLGIYLTVSLPFDIFAQFPILVAILWFPLSFTTAFLLNRNHKRKGVLAEAVIAIITYGIMLFVSSPAANFFGHPFFLFVPKYLRFPAILFVTSGLHLLLASIIELRKARTAILVTTGPYSFVRHPQHLAILIIVFGSFLPVFFPASLVNCLAFFLWFRKAGRIEEELFLRDPAISAKYKVYQARVPSLFPVKTKKPGKGARLN